MKTEKTFFTKTSVKLTDRQTPLRLAVTLGDPAGIGPEVVLKALASNCLSHEGEINNFNASEFDITRDCEITVVGSKSLLQTTYTQMLRQNPDSVESLADPAKLSILDVGDASIEHQITIGVGNAASGGASFAYMEAAIAGTLRGEFQGIITGPIAKSAWKAAGYNYPGQTELLAERAGVDKFGMLFVARSPHTGWTLRTLLATTHIPLRQVADTLTPQLLTAKLDLLVDCLRQDFGIEKARIAIAGLNPHSGEGGQLGREEQDWLISWLEAERQRLPHLQLDGLIPPDTMWVKPGQAWFGRGGEGERGRGGEGERGREGEGVRDLIQNIADAYLALYHDQGLIPVKVMAFDRAVNTSIGLPFVRTSPDHGTAFDIAGLGIADATSMKAALQLAAELAYQRIATDRLSCV